MTALCSCAAGADKTAITAITIESGKKSDAKLTVSATLSDGFIDEHGKKVQIYLIEFPAGCVGYGKESGEKAEIINAANNTVIGAGSVVTKDIPANCVAVGCPCRILRQIGDKDMEFYFKDRKIPDELKNN